jgi:hypothetical protein
VRGINASLDLIRRTRGGTWPTGPVTEEEGLRRLTVEKQQAGLSGQPEADNP